MFPLKIPRKADRRLFPTFERKVTYYQPRAGGIFLGGTQYWRISDGFSLALAKSLGSWTVPWGFLHLLWPRTTSAGQILRASWSGPALSSAADGPESWRRHQLQLRSGAQSSLLAVSPFKTKKTQVCHVNHVNPRISFRVPTSGEGTGTGMEWHPGRGRLAEIHFAFVTGLNLLLFFFYY